MVIHDLCPLRMKVAWPIALKTAVKKEYICDYIKTKLSEIESAMEGCVSF